jgi:hypothetical protein
MPWTWRKRARGNGPHAARGNSDEGGGEAELETFFEHALTLQKPPSLVFSADNDAEQIQLAVKCWSHCPLSREESVCHANPELAGVLRAMVVNSYRPLDAESYEERQFFRVEGVLSNLVRMQSQKNILLLTARVSIAAYRAQVPGKVWAILHAFAPGLIASYHWTHDFVDYGVQFRPPCAYEELPLVGGTMFDNYSRKVLYKSQRTLDSGGYMLNMTNWGSMIR